MKANPSGILLIGFGVVLINLAYTGRGKAVWDALRNGGSTPPATTQTAPTTPPAPPAEPTRQAGDGSAASSYLHRVFVAEDGITWGRK